MNTPASHRRVGIAVQQAGRRPNCRSSSAAVGDTFAEAAEVRGLAIGAPASSTRRSFRGHSTSGAGVERLSGCAGVVDVRWSRLCVY